MTPLIGAAARDAWRRWRRDREVILAIAGVFVFLPMFAWLLLVPEPTLPAEATGDQRTAAVIAWAGEHLHWLVLRIGFELFATAAILTFYLARDHADVRGVLRRGLAVLPTFAIAVMGSWGLVTLGVFAFIVPGLYIYGRVALTGAVLVGERGVGVAGAIARSVALTHGNGWRVAALLALPFLAGLMALQLIGMLDGAMRSAGTLNPIARALVDGAAALAATASGLARVLLQVSLYRRLASPRHAV
jgi:hypothetical protein